MRISKGSYSEARDEYGLTTCFQVGISSVHETDKGSAEASDASSWKDLCFWIKDESVVGVEGYGERDRRLKRREV